MKPIFEKNLKLLLDEVADNINLMGINFSQIKVFDQMYNGFYSCSCPAVQCCQNFTVQTVAMASNFKVAQF